MMLFERWVIVILTVIVFGIWVYEVVFTPLPKAKKKGLPKMKKTFGKNWLL